MSKPEPLKDLGVCPSCGSADVNAIWYGMPVPGYEELWPANARVGGCALRDDSPNRVCGACGEEWISSESNVS